MIGVTPGQYKKLKGIKRQNLQDHMNDFELIFTMLGERSTTEIHRNEDSKGVKKLKGYAKADGKIAGNARKELEKRLGRSVVSKNNYLLKKVIKITNKFKPWRLMYYFCFVDEKKAFAFEKYVKSGSGRAFSQKKISADGRWYLSPCL